MLQCGPNPMGPMQSMKANVGDSSIMAVSKLVVTSFLRRKIPPYFQGGNKATFIHFNGP